MKYEETIGKTVALLMMGKNASGEDEWVVAKGIVTHEVAPIEEMNERKGE